MAPENTRKAHPAAESRPSRTYGRRPVILSSTYEAALSAYAEHLGQSPLRGHSSRTYLSAVRGYLQWLEGGDVAGAPLADPRSRDRAVNEYTTWLRTVAKRSPATVNKTMAVLDDFYL